jgi:coniferyl-aldehyde dehydrogenase
MTPFDYVNARPRPLALYYFGDDDADRRKVLDRTTSGNVTINGTMMHVAQDDLPFVGVGASGMGAYHGVEGFRTFSHAKGIFEQGHWNFIDLLRAPFGSRANVLLKFLRTGRRLLRRSVFRKLVVQLAIQPALAGLRRRDHRVTG